MSVLNGGLASALGRPDLVPSVQAQGTMYSGGPPTVIAGSSASLAGSASVFAGNGRSALIMLMVLLGGYAAFTWWVRPHLA